MYIFVVLFSSEKQKWENEKRILFWFSFQYPHMNNEISRHTSFSWSATAPTNFKEDLNFVVSFVKWKIKSIFGCKWKIAGVLIFWKRMLRSVQVHDCQCSDHSSIWLDWSWNTWSSVSFNQTTKKTPRGGHESEKLTHVSDEVYLKMFVNATVATPGVWWTPGSHQWWTGSSLLLSSFWVI